MKRWERREVIQLWRLAGTRSVSSIAESLGRSSGSVLAKARTEGLSLARGTFTVLQVSRRLDCNERTVWNIIKRLELRVRRRHKQGRGYAMLSEEQVHRIEEKYRTDVWSCHGDTCRNCGRSDRRHHSHGFCQRCYDRWRKYRDEGEPWHTRFRAFLNQMMDAVDGRKLEYGLMEIRPERIKAVIEGDNHAADFEVGIS